MPYSLARDTLLALRRGKTPMPKVDPPVDYGVPELTPELKAKEIKEGTRVPDKLRVVPDTKNEYMDE